MDKRDHCPFTIAEPIPTKGAASRQSSTGRPAGHNYNSSLGDMIAGAVPLQIVTKTLAVMDCDVLIDNGTANLASSSNDTIIENDLVGIRVGLSH